MVNTDLSGADLTKADATNANLTGAKTTGALFTKVKWLNTTCPDGSNSSADGGSCVNNLG
jgi:uncharacterized protein YjbI with pentapeptide repeats